MKRKIIFRTRTGSNLYGLSTAESDTDYVSVFIPTSEDLLGLKKCEQIDNSTKSSSCDRRNTKEDTDDVMYSLPKFLHLALQNNPNIVELLFATPNVIEILEPEFKFLMHNYDKIISKRVFKTFTGYAFSQKKKLTVKSERYNSLVDAVVNIEAGYTRDELSDYSRAISDFEAGQLTSNVKYYKGRKNNTETFHKGMSIKMIYEKLVYERDNYGWRVKTDSFDKLRYDCYIEGTEFLTENGWKKYNDITDIEKLATINVDNKQLEFQNFSDKKLLPYQGEIYNIENMFTKCAITPNHKMLVSPCHRGLHGYKYKEEVSNWRLISVEQLNSRKPDNRSYYHLLNSVKNLNRDYKISDDYLMLAGAYLSEGTIEFKKSKSGKTVKHARIGQTLNGKLKFFSMMDKITNEFISRKYSNSKINHSKKIEYTWWYTNKKTAEKLYSDFGHLSKNKKIPNWVLKLSKRQAALLLNSLILGDGTERKFCFCYNTISKKLADSVQILAFLSEKNTNLKRFTRKKDNKISEFYHIYISKEDAKPKATYFNTETKRRWRFRRKTNCYRGLIGGTKINYNGNVCCFTTKNSTLITRLGGKIAIQGNCKFAYHLIRISAEGSELLETGKLSYPISGEAKKDIIAIREGEVSYDGLMKLYEKWDARCKEAEEKTKLLSKPDFNWANNWLISILRKSIIKESDIRKEFFEWRKANEEY